MMAYASSSDRDLPSPELFLGKFTSSGHKDMPVGPKESKNFADDKLPMNKEEHNGNKSIMSNNLPVSDMDSNGPKVDLHPSNLVPKSRIDDSVIRNMIVKCSACGKQVNHHDPHRVKKHPHLGVLVCKDCSEFYGTGEFSQDEDGDKYCRWCAQGGQVYGCDFCSNVFCSDCLRRNFGRGEPRKIRETNWKCYICDPSQLKEKVSFCEMILKYTHSSKQFKKSNKRLNQSTVVCPLDSLDNTTFQPAEWLPVAFDSALAMSIRFRNKIEKLRRHATSGKSTKQIVRKLEQVMDNHKTDTKTILNKVLEKYQAYSREKLSKSLSNSKIINLSDGSEGSVVNTVHSTSIGSAKVNDFSSTKRHQFTHSAQDLSVLESHGLQPTLSPKTVNDVSHQIKDEGEPSLLHSRFVTDHSDFKKESAVEDETLGEASSVEDNKYLKRNDTELFGETHSEDEKMQDVFKLIDNKISSIKKEPTFISSDVPKLKTVGVSGLSQSVSSAGSFTVCQPAEDANANAKNALLKNSDDSASEISETSTIPNASDSEKTQKNVNKHSAQSSSDSHSESSTSSDSEVGQKGKSRQRKPAVKPEPTGHIEKVEYFTADDIIPKDKFVNDPYLNSRPIVIVEKLNISQMGIKLPVSSGACDPDNLSVKEEEQDELNQLKKYVQTLSRLPTLKRSHKTSVDSSKETYPAVKRKKLQDTKILSSNSEYFSLSSAEEATEIHPVVRTKAELKDLNHLSKDTLLQNDTDSNSSSDISSESSNNITNKGKSAAVKKADKSYSPDLTNLVSDDDDDDEDALQFVLQKKKKSDKLLTISLANSDEENSKDKRASCSVKEKKKTKKRKVIYSDDSEKSENSSVQTSDSEHEMKGKNNKKHKKRRVKIDDSSDEDKEQDGEINNSQGTPGKGRKNIRKVISDKKLTEATREAQEAEKERRKRIADRQRLYNKIVDVNPDGTETITRKMVLEVDPDSKEEVVEIHPDVVGKLKPHQINGVKFMWECTIESLKELNEKPGSGCILAHCMGLGKTLQVIAYLYTILTNKFIKKKLRTAMIICPYNTVLNWVSEFEKWLDDAEEEVSIFELASVKSTFSRRDYLQQWQGEGGVLILGYNIFARLAAGKIPRVSKKVKEAIFQSLCDPGPDIVVCDEGHMLKNEHSFLSKAANKLRTRRRIVLTGTPLQNNLKEYHCMMNFVKPNLLGTLKEFTNRFVNPIINGQYDDSSKYDVKLMKKRVHILHKLLEGCVHRCDYSALTKCLPPKHEFVISVKLSDIQIKLYRHFLDTFVHSNNLKVDGRKLFQDYNVLKNIWTYPWILYMAYYRAEKNKLKQMLKDEDSMSSFINDDSEESSKDGSDNNDECDAKPGPSKKASEGSEDEVIRVYKTRSRSGVEGIDESEDSVVEVDELISKNQWWNEFITEEEKFKIEFSGKMVLVLDILRQCQSIGDKVLLFSQSLLALDMIEEVLGNIDDKQAEKTDENNIVDSYDSWENGIDYFRMDGSTGVDLRKHWIELFNSPENDRARLFLISTKAGSLGTNLIGANRVILMDASWNPSHDVQAIFRVYRFGQTKPVYIYRLLAQGTMEEKIYNRQVTKLSLSCRVVDEQQIDRHYNAAQLAELYTFEPDTETNHPTPMVPKDRLLADILMRHSAWIVKYHEHDSLLQCSTEDDLTEEERQAAWAEYENEKDAAFGATNFPGIQPNTGFQNIDVNTSNFEFYTANSVLDVESVISKFLIEMKKKIPGVTDAQLLGKLHAHLMDLRSHYQLRHVSCLRSKQQMISKGETVPPAVSTYLAQLGESVDRINRFILNTQMKLGNLHLKQQQQSQPSYRPHVPPSFSSQHFASKFQNAQHYKDKVYRTTVPDPATTRFININDGRSGVRLPPGAKVVQAFTVGKEPPTIVDVTSERGNNISSSSRPIITEVDDVSELNGGQNITNKPNSLEITEID